MKWLGIIALGLWALPWPAVATGQERTVVPYDGVEAFCNILNNHDLTSLKSMEELAQADPARTLVIVMGERTGLERIAKAAGGLQDFRKRGGALFIASDYPGKLADLEVDIGALKIRQNAFQSYQGRFEECPLVVPFGNATHPVLRDLTLPLATNRPTFLQVKDPRVERLAVFGPGCYYAGPLPFKAEGILYCAGSPANASATDRLLVMAGHGLLTNHMQVQQDNDNFILANNAVRWLCEGPNGPRRQVLVLHQGQIITRLDLPLGALLPDGIPIGLINQFIRGIEEERLIQSLLLEEVGRDNLVRGYWIAFSIIFLVLAARRYMKSANRSETKIPLIVGLQDPPPPEAPVLEQRLRNLADGGNLVEIAQVLARQWFQEHAGIPPQAWDLEQSPDFSGARYSGGFFQRRKLERMLRELTAVAHAEPGTRITRQRLGQVHATLQVLTAALRNGAMIFADGFAGTAGERGFADGTRSVPATRE